MRQERKRYTPYGEKFEDGVLRVDACSERYSIPRDMQYRTFDEDLPSYAFGMSAVWEEKRLLRDAHQLIALGVRLEAGQTLEDFVAQHSEVLEREVI